MSLQMTLGFVLLMMIVLWFSFFMIYSFTSEVFVSRYFQEVRRSLSVGPMMRGPVVGHGQMARRVVPDLFISFNNEIIQNPDMIDPPEFREGSTIIRSNTSSYLLFGFRDDDSALLLGLKMSEFDIYLSSLRSVMIVAFILAITATTGLAILLGKRISRPLKETSKMLQQLMVSDLSQRLLTRGSSLEVNRLHESINDALSKIEDGYKRQQQFSSDVAHEIRSPLTSIMGFSRLILRWGADDPRVVKEAASNILKTSQSLLGISEALMFLSMADQHVDIKTTDLKKLVDEAAEPFARYAYSQIEVDVPSVEVTTDETLFGIVLSNLLDNATKHSRRGPVLVKWFGETGELVIVDSAPRIPDKERERIFDRFYRSDQTTDLNGYGLGLSLVRKICDVIGLSVRVEPADGAGNRFVLGGLN